MTDMVNIVESVCQDPGRPFLTEQEAQSKHWSMVEDETQAAANF